MFEFLKKFRKQEQPQQLPEATEVSGLTELEVAKKIADVFPGISHLAINLTITGPDNDVEPSLNNRSFGPQSRAYFVFRCKNADCVDGGFDLQDDLLAATDEGRNEFSGRRLCHGWRNASVVGQQKCYYELNFRAHISYSVEHA
ncbi:MAG: hypothetical protein OER80_10370 [Gammaproteobacteria bacterium]|nr:hypothetical protein [Gammaproteobacteria bacterium]MDH3767106.1 hypothetical protein [Gammaproteobacteria bacterium]